MSTTYVGSTDWCESAYPSISVDAYGVDTVTREYNGRNDKINTFVASYKRNRDLKDEDYPLCTLSDIQIIPGRGISKATVRYTGVASRDGSLPSPVFSGGRRSQSVSIPYIGDTLGQSTGVIATFEYYAPYTTKVEYIRMGKSSQASTQTRKYLSERAKRESVQRFSLGDKIEVFARTGAQGTLKIFDGSLTIGQVASAIQASNAYVAIKQIYTSQSSYEQVGSIVARVTTTTETRLIPADLGNIQF